MGLFVQNFIKENALIAYSFPFYTLLIILEVVVSNYHHQKLYSFKETLINFWLNLLNSLIGLSFKGIALLLFTYFYHLHFIQITQPYLYWVCLFIGLDFCFYWEHRSEHFCRLLWAVHVTHHSSLEYNLTTGFRSSVLRPFVSLWFFIPLSLLGFKPLDILFMDAICQIYGILVHTQTIKKMPNWFELFFVSPSHHRVHHASNIPYLDKNMGMILIIWDRLFGTFAMENENEQPHYGIVKNIDQPHHPIKIITHEWVNLTHDLTNTKSWVTKLKYLFYPPGWSPDGSTLTAKQMQEKL